uniref:C2 domain-containing protein n=1 Tax=Kalanchoe fedtschenkoi TaxID=63787 RepID=A0A7N1A222_KALFE
MTMSIRPFQLLELNVISAQDLFQTSRSMKTYAVAWVHPDRKLSTRVDTTGRTNPTWNDKFVFRVNEEFLRADTSAIMVQIYALHWFRDVLVGTVRVIVGNLLPPTMKSHRQRGPQHVGMRFVALQVWRPSGRPQGILNVGATVLDGSMRSMPLYTQLSSSAVGYRDLMGEEDPLHFHHHPLHHHHHQTGDKIDNNKDDKNPANEPNPNYTALKPILRRTRSDRSEMERKPALEMEELSQIKSSMLSGSDVPSTVKMKNGKVKSGSELGISLRVKKTGNSRASSVISGSDIIFYKKDVTKTTPPNDNRGKPEDPKENKNASDPQPKKTVNEKVVAFEGFDPPAKKAAAAATPQMGKQGDYNWPGLIPPNKPPANQKKMPNAGGGPYQTSSMLSFSDVGPSPSEMAAIVAQKYPAEGSNSVLEGWSVDESVEGLRSKLERWRMELPPVYDLGGEYASYPSSGEDSKRSLSKHARRHTDGGATVSAAAAGNGGGGLFSCFGNVFGYECSCVCGKPPGGAGPMTSKQEVAGSRMPSRMQSPWVQH